MMILTNLRARYIVPISVREARSHMVAMFGVARIAHGSTCYYVAGVVFCLAVGPVIARIFYGRVPGGRK